MESRKHELKVRGDSHDLTEVLLRQTHDPLATGMHLPVEPFDTQHLLTAKGQDLCFGRWQAELGEQVHAQRFVLDRRAEVRLAVSNHPNG